MLSWLRLLPVLYILWTGSIAVLALPTSNVGFLSRSLEASRSGQDAHDAHRGADVYVVDSELRFLSGLQAPEVPVTLEGLAYIPIVRAPSSILARQVPTAPGISTPTYSNQSGDGHGGNGNGRNTDKDKALTSLNTRIIIIICVIGPIVIALLVILEVLVVRRYNAKKTARLEEGERYRDALDLTREFSNGRGKGQPFVYASEKKGWPFSAEETLPTAVSTVGTWNRITTSVHRLGRATPKHKDNSALDLGQEFAAARDDGVSSRNTSPLGQRNTSQQRNVSLYNSELRTPSPLRFPKGRPGSTSQGPNSFFTPNAQLDRGYITSLAKSSSRSPDSSLRSTRVALPVAEPARAAHSGDRERERSRSQNERYEDERLRRREEKRADRAESLEAEVRRAARRAEENEAAAHDARRAAHHATRDEAAAHDARVSAREERRTEREQSRSQIPKEPVSEKGDHSRSDVSRGRERGSRRYRTPPVVV